MKQYSREDFAHPTATVRWCPGCGDYAVLAAVQRALAELGLPPEKHVFVSGIGCAGRLPYYMNTYGFHTIHGRALAVATGLKSLRDDLSVWVITGDGDALSIGGNHFLHCLRRNVNVNILLLNNQVYGLTKGQFSPTSPVGQVTKTSPDGVTSAALNPIKLALAAGATFVARAVDKDPAHLTELLHQAHAHAGTSLIEIYQDCHVFNPGAFDEFSAKQQRADNVIYLKSGEPLVYGQDKNKALVFRQGKFACAASNVMDIPLHNPSDSISALHLSTLNHPEYPVPLGILYQAERETFKFSCTLKKNMSDLPVLFAGQ